MPYWNCPYTEPDACELPNECFCPGDFQEIICNNTKYLEQLLKKSCPGDSFCNYKGVCNHGQCLCLPGYFGTECQCEYDFSNTSRGL